MDAGILIMLAGWVLLIVPIVLAVFGVRAYRKRLSSMPNGPVPSSTGSTPKFCPKCGNALAGGATFCSKCGNKLDAAAVTQSSHTFISNSTLPKIGIASIACALFTIILSFFPWCEVGSISSFTQGAASFFGGSSSAYAFEPTYWVWGAFSLSDTMGNYLTFFGSSRSADAASYSVLAFLSVIGWLASLALIIWGSYNAFTKQKMLMLRIGNALMLVASSSFTILAAALQDLGHPTAFPIVCICVAFVALAFSIAVPTKKA